MVWHLQNHLNFKQSLKTPKSLQNTKKTSNHKSNLKPPKKPQTTKLTSNLRINSKPPNTLQHSNKQHQTTHTCVFCAAPQSSPAVRLFARGKRQHPGCNQAGWRCCHPLRSLPTQTAPCMSPGKRRLQRCKEVWMSGVGGKKKWV